MVSSLMTQKMLLKFVMVNNMRLDKYLKVSRIIKRRTLSKEMAESERVYVNGKAAKPSHKLSIGDEICVTFGRREITVKVLQLKEHVLKDESHLMYELISDRKLEVEE